MTKPTTLERAFELANEGCPLRNIRQTLAREGYDQSHIFGVVVRQLSARIEAARAKHEHDQD